MTISCKCTAVPELNNLELYKVNILFLFLPGKVYGVVILIFFFCCQFHPIDLLKCPVINCVREDGHSRLLQNSILNNINSINNILPL